MQTINTYYNDFHGLRKFVHGHGDILLNQDNEAVLVQVFSGIIDRNVLYNVSQQILQLIPRVQIIGTTTNGEIINGVVSGLSIALSFSVFRHSKVRLVSMEKAQNSDQELGQLLASRLHTDQAKVLILFSTGLTVNATQLLKGIQTTVPCLPVAGGSAGDNLNNKQCFVFTHETITDCGVVGALLSGEDLTIIRHSHLGWQPIGKEMTLTRTEGARVYTIDHMPAYQVYQRYLGANEEFDIINGVEFPLVIDKHGLEIARCPYIRYEDDSLAFFGDMDEGNKVRFSYGHIDLILQKIDCLLQTISEQPVQSIFVYSCAARRSFLHEAAQIETLPLQNIAPTAGFFTSGEYFHADNSNQFLNNTMTTLAMYEAASFDKVCSRKPQSILQSEPTPDQVSSAVDNVTTRNVGILRALTFLVNTVTSELDERTVELQKANELLQYTSRHDALTGLYNRGYFEQQLLEMKASSPGIVMCDVDGLKLINDTFGHNMGDAILIATADIIRSILKPGNVAARIGGDEFSILIPNSSQSEIENYARALRQAVDRYNLLNPVIPLSMSIGFSLRGDFKDADDKMYREKLHRSQSTHSDLVQTLVKTLEARDIITDEHSQRLEDLLVAFAMHNGISGSSLADLRLLARFHDIGKVGIPDHVLFKPGPLTPEERKDMQRHCEIGHRIAHSSSDLLPIAEWILKHHEWWNGQGYPLGLKGKDIPLECRILSIVDSYDAMVNDRPYRKAMSHKEALNELRHCAGVQFDPHLVDLFIGMMGKFESSTRWFEGANFRGP